MITYHPLKGPLGLIDVKLDNKQVGQIRPESPPYGSAVTKVFRYWPLGCKTAAAAGSPFATLASCKRSLENDTHS